MKARAEQRLATELVRSEIQSSWNIIESQFYFSREASSSAGNDQGEREMDLISQAFLCQARPPLKERPMELLGPLLALSPSLVP